ncbi:iron ABC transporter permease [Gordonia polyisoprenivorans]|uniref:FecCD family ABC transporter permease n=1 Tax=Gordonia polyisoprenivorans TaxID=84595 RepID=UPI0030D321BD
MTVRVKRPFVNREAPAARRRWGRPAAVLTVLAVGTPVLAVLMVGVGQVTLGPGAVLDALTRTGGATPTSAAATVLWELRLPRVIVGLCVGGVLGATGCALQAIVRNDLADPYLLGVSSGASLGAALVIATGFGAAVGVAGATTGAFLGAVVALMLVVGLLGGARALSSSRLVLAGLTVGYFAAAVTNLVVVLSDNRDAVRAVMFWMLGSLGKSSWQQVPVLVAVSVLVVAVLALWGRRLDAVGLGDDVARSIGVDAQRLRLRVAVLSALAIAAAVAVSGAIGFVGLVVPHLARHLVGATHRLLIPTSALIGASVLIAADALARTALAPREIPLGVLTALIGTPLLMYLLHRRRRSESH